MTKIDAAPSVQACVFCLAVATGANAQTPRVGVEFQVNSATLGTQNFPAVDMEDAGDFVVAWVSYEQDGDDQGVFARRFDFAGIAKGQEFQVNLYTSGIQGDPAVALDADGDFVIAWTSIGQDGGFLGVFARRYSAAGATLGGEFQVNAHTAYNQFAPSVSRDAFGGFVITWMSQDGDQYGVFARRFDPSGVAQANEFQVHARTGGNQSFPTVGLDTDGDFVIAWQSELQDGSEFGIRGRRFDFTGAPQGVEFSVNTYTLGAQVNPVVGVTGGGDFMIAWQGPGDGAQTGIFARRFSANGAPQTGEFGVNATMTNAQTYPTIDAMGDGTFVLAWQSTEVDGLYFDIRGRRFGVGGAPLATEFEVNSYVTGQQFSPAAATAENGTFVVAWSDGPQDGDGGGVFAQRFAIPAVLDVDGNGATAALTDGLLVLRFLFGFTDAALVSGAVDLGNCTRCDASSIEAYLQTLV